MHNTISLTLSGQIYQNLTVHASVQIVICKLRLSDMCLRKINFVNTYTNNLIYSSTFKFNYFNGMHFDVVKNCDI